MRTNYIQSVSMTYRCTAMIHLRYISYSIDIRISEHSQAKQTMQQARDVGKDDMHKA